MIIAAFIKSAAVPWITPLTACRPAWSVLGCDCGYLWALVVLSLEDHGRMHVRMVCMPVSFIAGSPGCAPQESPTGCWAVRFV